MMNELFISYPDLLENFQRRSSKTPCRLRMKNSFSSKNNHNILNSTKNSTLKIKMNRSVPCKRNQNWKQNKIKKNIRKNNTTPLMKHIREREKEREREKIKKEKNKKIEKNKIKKKSKV